MASDDELDGGSDLSDLDGSSDLSELSGAQTPGGPVTPGQSPQRIAASDVAEKASPVATKKNGRGVLRGTGRAKKTPIASDPPAKKASKGTKTARGWVYVSPEEQAQQEEARRAAEARDAEVAVKNGRPVRRRSSTAARGATSRTPEPDAAPQGGRKIKIRVKEQRADEKASGSAPTDAAPTEAADEKQFATSESEDEGPRSQRRKSVAASKAISAEEKRQTSKDPGSRKRKGGDKRRADAHKSKARSKGREAKRASRVNASDDGEHMDVDGAEDSGDSFSDAASESDEERVSKKVKKESAPARVASKSSNGPSEREKGDTESARGMPSSVSSPRPPLSTDKSRPAQSTPTSTNMPVASGSSPARPAVRPVARKPPSLLNNLMGFGPAPAARDTTPSRNVAPRPRPGPLDTPGGLKKPVDGRTSSDATVKPRSSLSDAQAPGRSLGQASQASNAGLNGEHVTAQQMQELRERERYEHAHPHGLFDLLEDAETMMEFEEETRQELRHDEFLHKYKLYKPGRTEGVWKLVERIKERRAAASAAAEAAAAAAAAAAAPMPAVQNEI